MGNFRSEGRGGGGFGGGRSGGSRFGGNRSGGSRFSSGRDFSRGDRRTEMHDATCGNCGKPCQVPFKPYPGKKVLCSNCFGNDSPRNNFTPSAGATGASAEQFAQINAKLDKIMAILSELELDVEEDDEDADEVLDEDAEDDEDDVKTA